MTEEERDDLIDLLPMDMVVWNDEEELQHFGHATARWWMDTMGHPVAGPTHPCCKSCGCGGTCTLGAFHDAMISSVVRELDRIGALKKPDPEGARCGRQLAADAKAATEATGGWTQQDDGTWTMPVDGGTILFTQASTPE
ncbi:hypothetical protein FNV62_43545 [Streptomyces sp. RLB3-17]|uniref:hypothetical protein n=1 Tax=unclassified Streptomyces TaxID=2593676 RepID=UPI00116306CD|nr:MULTISPECIES: hypothetical protein [unclassified Streptomyces]QDO02189.1 hypothetical protein FNV58_45160 [Streptomyces sp. RLB1-9]QDO23923.1 hypothetical protein FNV65_43745 [Streptomyces sp. S1A1-8]QDO34048.1 hypothetical protein FNV63_43770 [Streptomyces sp. S1A1-3]QDO44050.1 hypothetical protein FNV62_43545 [Streptomyces sp. RLB3-17]